MLYNDTTFSISATSKHAADHQKPSNTCVGKIKRMSANVHQFAPDEKEWKPCNCTDSIQRTMSAMNNDAVGGGCENSAMLHHGSYIRFGCLQFAFTIIDYTYDSSSDSYSNVKEEKCENAHDEKSINKMEQVDVHKVEENKGMDGIGSGETSPEAPREFEDNTQASESMEIDP